jgi:2-dehydropantoate 2-reductase
MKVCIYGTGAIGGFVGARLASQGHDMSVVARSATMAAVRSHGLRLQLKDQLLAARVRAESDPAALGPQDLVVIAVKAPSLREVAERIPPLIGSGTIVLTAMNGVPWWLFDGFGGQYIGMRLIRSIRRNIAAPSDAMSWVVWCT